MLLNYSTWVADVLNAIQGRYPILWSTDEKKREANGRDGGRPKTQIPQCWATIEVFVVLFKAEA